MPSAKKTITEEYAAAIFLASVMHDTEGRWPEICALFRELIHDETFVFADEYHALFDLFLAVVAGELGALTNIFSAEQASRLSHLCTQSFESGETRDYASAEICEYRRFFSQALAEGENPMYAIPVRLLHRWLGARIKDFEVKLQGKSTGFISPLLVTGFTVEVFLRLIGIGRWKRILEQHEILPEVG